MSNNRIVIQSWVAIGGMGISVIFLAGCGIASRPRTDAIVRERETSHAKERFVVAADRAGTGSNKSEPDPIISCEPTRPNASRSGPDTNSVGAAYGSTQACDFHIDTAKAFLVGSGENSNHVPDDWPSKLLSIDASCYKGRGDASGWSNDGTSKFADIDPTNGIDTRMLFFYAGHGGPDRWQVPATNDPHGSVAASDIRIGDSGNGGHMRYYWQCSCQVFAHGGTGAVGDFARPDEFRGGVDRVTQRNAFARWGPSFGSELRMACGMSTLAYCTATEVDAIWDNINNRHMPPAFAFIDAFGGEAIGEVDQPYTTTPVCMTTSDQSNPERTPLFDRQFSIEPNASDHTYLHMLYAVNSYIDGEDAASHAAYPSRLPQISTVPTTNSPRFRKWLRDSRKLRRGAHLAVSSIDPAIPQFLVRLPSGPLLDAIRTSSNAAIAASAKRIARQIGWLGDEQSGLAYRTVISRLRTQTVLAAQPSAPVEPKDAGWLIAIQTGLSVGGRFIQIQSRGGFISFTLMSGNAAEVTISRPRTDFAIERIEKPIAVRSYEDALAEARQQLGGVDYILRESALAYDNPTGNASTKLSLVYRFHFVPNVNDTCSPLRVIGIPANEGTSSHLANVPSDAQ